VRGCDFILSCVILNHLSRSAPVSERLSEMSEQTSDRRRHPKTSRSSLVKGRLSRPAPEIIVRKGWNHLSAIYRPPGSKSDCFLHTDKLYREWLRPVIENLAFEAPVLDLGCGTGEPASVELAKRFDVTGVDVSEVMVKRAHLAVPTARLIRADMTKVDFPPDSFDAIVSLYAIIHVPLAKQKPLLTRIHSWLRSKGLFVVILGHEAWQGTEQGWLGSRVPMFWSHTDASTYRQWLRGIGFTVLRQEFVPEGNSGHELFVLRKRS
jgi:SAM-dependent methyltransferase